MSFGGARVKPDSLQLSVIGYNDMEHESDRTEGSIEKQNDHVRKQAYEKVYNGK